MVDIRAALQQIADDLTAAGAAATIDARDLNLPGVWVVASQIGLDYLSPGTWSLQVHVFLISADLGTPESLDQLSELLAMVAPVVGAVDATPQGVVLPSLGADPLPALQITLETKVDELP